MEYCDGHCLQEIIDTNSFDSPVDKFKINILQQILDALVYSHAQGMAHRDLKPSNIFLDRNRQIVKLADFALSSELDSVKAEGSHPPL